MFNILISLLMWGQTWTAPPPIGTQAGCGCPAVIHVEKSGQTSSSISYTWDSPDGATAYRVWYYHQTGHFTSQVFTANNASFTFSGLVAGTYTFYFAAVCGEEVSSFVGVEDLVSF